MIEIGLDRNICKAPSYEMLLLSVFTYLKVEYWKNNLVLSSHITRL